MQKTAQQKNGVNCPICDRPPQRAFAPFCSRRCADLDLGRWLKGSYVIPGDRTSTGQEPEEN